MALFFFFKKIVVSGKENLIHQGPLIIVANHPNTLIDPLIIASITDQQIGFLAKAELFSNALLGKILKYFNVIPIFRKIDVSIGEKPDNKFAFEKCHEFLNKKGTILIFPEGNSFYELKLREIKTGTARIALSFESALGQEQDLKILPIALDYSDAIQFRSMVAVTIDEPIALEAYKKLYQEDEIESVLQLTENIHQVLDKHIPNTTNKEQEQFLLKTHSFYTTFNDPSSNLYLSVKKSLQSRTLISKAFHILQENNPNLYEDTESKVYLFFERLYEEQLTPGFFTDRFIQKSKTLVITGYFLKFIFLTPIYLLGLAVNYIPYILPFTVFQKSKLEIEYKTSLQLVVGLVTFPLLYSLEIMLIGQFVPIHFWDACLLVITFLITGYIAMFYWTEVKRFKRVLYYYFFMKTENKGSILKLRDAILKNIEIAKSNL